MHGIFFPLENFFSTGKSISGEMLKGAQASFFVLKNKKNQSKFFQEGKERRDLVTSKKTKDSRNKKRKIKKRKAKKNPDYYSKKRKRKFDGMKARCPKCFRLRKMTVHHVFPQRHFGNTENVIYVCRDCHDEIESILPERELKEGSYLKLHRKWLAGELSSSKVRRPKMTQKISQAKMFLVRLEDFLELDRGFLRLKFSNRTKRKNFCSLLAGNKPISFKRNIPDWSMLDLETFKIRLEKVSRGLERISGNGKEALIKNMRPAGAIHYLEMAGR